jgi:hypothetical protein
MKKLLTGLLTISSVGLLMLTSCKKSDKLATDTGSTASTLTVSTTSPALSAAMINDTSTIIKFSFTSPNYTYKGAGQQNEIQVDAAGDNWKNPAETVLTSNSEGFTTFALAKLLIGLNLPAGKQTQVNVRVANKLSAESALYSNVVTLTVTPINLASWIYVPGDYEGWGNPGTKEDSLISASSNGIYTGIIDFRGYAGSTGTLQFKLVPVKGSWTVSYGDAGGGTISTSGGNLSVPTAAPYLLTVNLNTNTITMVPANYYSVIGDAALGWSTDIPMNYINDGKGNWTLVTSLASTGAFKVRENDDWTYSWGIPQAGSAGDGVANTLNDTKNNNITVPSTGNYLVEFNEPASAQSSSFTPLVTTTYSVTAQ